MIFQPPSWLSAGDQDPSAQGTVGDFVLRGAIGTPSADRLDEPVLISAHAPAERTKTVRQLAEDVEALATGLANDLGWSSNEANGSGKVIAILSENTVCAVGR